MHLAGACIPDAGFGSRDVSRGACAANIPVQGPGWGPASGHARERPRGELWREGRVKVLLFPRIPSPPGTPPQQHTDEEWKSSSW